MFKDDDLRHHPLYFIVLLGFINAWVFFLAGGFQLHYSFELQTNQLFQRFC